MAASHYYRDHPFNRNPGPGYPPGDYPVNPAADSPSGADAHHRRRRAGEGIRSQSAPKRSRRDGHHPSREDESRRGRRHRDPDDHRPHRSDSTSSVSRSPPPKPRRRKSLGEQALEALGLGGSTSYESDRHRKRSRERGHYDDRHHRDYDLGRSRKGHRRRNRSYSRSPSPNRSSKAIKTALTAALTAGAAEAFRARKEPGGWTGEKGRRVLTAAMSARGVDRLIERDSSRHTKRNFLESTIAGLASTHLMKGGRSGSRSRSRHGRRVRSESHNGMQNLAAAGAAAAGKKAYDYYQSKRRASSSGYSSDESDQPHRHRKKRSQSMTDYVAKGLAALGLTDEVDDKRHSRHRHGRDRSPSDDDGYSDEYPPRRRERRSRHSR